MIVGDLAVANHDVMREHASHSFVEAAADRFVGNLEVIPRLRVSCVQLGQSLLDKIKRGSRGVGLEVRPRAVALDGVAPLWNLPFELDFRFEGSPGQVDFYAVAGRLDVADINLAGKRRGPEARDRSAAGVEREIVAGPFVIPAR